MTFGRVLRGLGSVLNPQVAQELAQEEAQDKGLEKQLGTMVLQQKLAERSPQYQMQMESLKNERLFREASANSGGDIGKITSAAIQYGKPELAVQLLNQQENRALRAQQVAEAMDTKRMQLQQNHEVALQRITDGQARQAEIERHNKAVEALSAQGHAAKQEASNLAHQIKLMQLELAGNKAEVDRLRKVDTETTKLQAALEKANLPEVDAVLGQVEKALDKAPKVAEYLSGPKSVMPDWAVPEEVRSARQAFQKLFNITLKNRSGAAVTSQELERLKQEFATGAFKDAKQIIDAVNQARNIINKHYASVAAGFEPSVLGNYNERIRQFGGRVVIEAGDKKEDPLGIR